MGAYDGDSAAGFYEAFGGYKRMYLYDMSNVNLANAQNNLKDYKNIIYRNVGVSNKENAGKVINVANTDSSMHTLLNKKCLRHRIMMI